MKDYLSLYTNVLINSLAEIPGFLLSAIMVEKVSRKFSMLLKLPHCGKNRGYAFSYVSKMVQLSLCSWDPRKRPTTINALQHPFFQSFFYVPPSLRTKAAIAKTPPSGLYCLLYYK
ncbi:hypothetical protein KY285_020298 [Solanum tuberosum]|nr:hypothetical protein KY285_020298 [Solanum tuberosum]